MIFERNDLFAPGRKISQNDIFKILYETLLHLRGATIPYREDSKLLLYNKTEDAIMKMYIDVMKRELKPMEDLIPEKKKTVLFESLLHFYKIIKEDFYRDHIIHTIYVTIIGDCILDHFKKDGEPLNRDVGKELASDCSLAEIISKDLSLPNTELFSSPPDYQKLAKYSWAFTSLFHDIGYYSELNFGISYNASKKFLKANITEGQIKNRIRRNKKSFIGIIKKLCDGCGCFDICIDALFRCIMKKDSGFEAYIVTDEDIEDILNEINEKIDELDKLSGGVSKRHKDELRKESNKIEKFRDKYRNTYMTKQELEKHLDREKINRKYREDIKKKSRFSIHSLYSALELLSRYEEIKKKDEKDLSDKKVIMLSLLAAARAVIKHHIPDIGNCKLKYDDDPLAYLLRNIDEFCEMQRINLNAQKEPGKLQLHIDFSSDTFWMIQSDDKLTLKITLKPEYLYLYQKIEPKFSDLNRKLNPSGFIELEVE